MTTASSNPPGDVSSAAERVRRAGGVEPRVGVVLGSGLGAFADTLVERVAVPYADVPGMPVPLVAGHAGNLVLGRVERTPVACLQGRVHLYEGHAPRTVVFGARLLAELGCRVVLLTNAAGGVRSDLEPGSLMLVVDHINLMGSNPLVGPNDPAGPRFPDMTRAYDPQVLDAAREAARELETVLAEGVYAAMLGPTYETPAEVRMVRTLGGDAVGMSTVPEVIALRHRGVRVGAISCITNAAAGVTDASLDHAEVAAVAGRTRDRFSALLRRWVQRVAELGAERSEVS